MGEVIRRDAAASDILTDCRITMTNAAARGGDWQAQAEERLGPELRLADGVEARLTQARAEAAPAEAAVKVENEGCDKLLGRVSDDIWNIVGRPRNDPALDVLFPGGIAYYAEGPVEEQPIRMTLLADLLEGGIHPKLSAERAAEFATEIRQAAARLEERVDAARPLTARVRLAEKMLGAIARAAHVALTRLKAQWKADGRTEAEIHSVIPDRPSRRGTGGGGGPTPTT